MRSCPKGIPDPKQRPVSDPHVHVRAPVVVHRQRLGGPLPLIIAAPDANWVHVAPVGLRLGMLQGISVHFARARQQELCTHPLCEPEHVERAHDVGLDGLDRVELVEDGGGGARQVVDLVDLEEDGLDHVVADELELGVAQVVHHVILAACHTVFSILNEDFRRGGQTSRLTNKAGAQNLELGVTQVVDHDLLAACDTVLYV
jgi:hypothetical protein